MGQRSAFFLQLSSVVGALVASFGMTSHSSASNLPAFLDRRIEPCASALLRESHESIKDPASARLEVGSVRLVSIGHPDFIESLRVTTEVFHNPETNLSIAVTTPQIEQQQVPEMWSDFLIANTQGEAKVMQRFLDQSGPYDNVDWEVTTDARSIGVGTPFYDPNDKFRMMSILEMLKVFARSSGSQTYKYESMLQAANWFDSYVLDLTGFAMEQYRLRRGWVEILQKLPKIALNTAERSIHLDLWQTNSKGEALRRVGVFRMMMAPWGRMRVKDPNKIAYNKILKSPDTSKPPIHENGYTTFWGSFGKTFWDFYGYPESRRRKLNLHLRTLPVEQNFKGHFFVDRKPKEERLVRDPKLLFELRMLTEEAGDEPPEAYLGEGFAIEPGNLAVLTPSSEDGEYLPPKLFQNILAFFGVMISKITDELDVTFEMATYGDVRSQRMYKSLLGFRTVEVDMGEDEAPELAKALVLDEDEFKIGWQNLYSLNPDREEFVRRAMEELLGLEAQRPVNSSLPVRAPHLPPLDPKAK